MSTNKKGIGIVLIGIAAVFIGFSVLFLSRSMAIVDYGATNIPGIGCDSCLFAREFLSGYGLVFGIIAGFLGIVGTWAIVKGIKEPIQRKEA